MQIMPHSKEIELCLLGSLILGEEARINLAGKIKKGDWYFDKNKIIFKAINELEDKKEVVDMVTVAEKVNSYDLKWFDDIATYITNIVNQVPTWRNYEGYAAKLLHYSKCRQAIKTAEQIKQLAYDNELETIDLTSKSEELVFDFSSESDKEQDYKAVKDFSIDHMTEIWDRKNQEGIVGIETPFEKLNVLTGGLKGNKLIVLAAKPGVGKTTIASNICDKAEIDEKAVGIFSLEMTKYELLERKLAKEVGISFQKIERGLLSEAEKEMIQKKYVEIHERNKIIIDDKENLSIEEIRSKARRMKKEHDIQLVMIDYLQLVRDDKHDSKAEKYEYIARECKNMAKELDITVILLCQLSRSVDSRNDKRPMMSDLKGSSGIEDAADIIIFLYRESMYNKSLMTAVKQNGKMNIHQLAYVTEVIIEKNRQGRTGFFLLDFEPPIYKFFDCPESKVEKYKEEVFG